MARAPPVSLSSLSERTSIWQREQAAPQGMVTRPLRHKPGSNLSDLRRESWSPRFEPTYIGPVLDKARVRSQLDLND
jgi:hypothetical protein